MMYLDVMLDVELECDLVDSDNWESDYMLNMVDWLDVDLVGELENEILDKDLLDLSHDDLCLVLDSDDDSLWYMLDDLV